jgi:hypothetical protein
MTPVGVMIARVRAALRLFNTSDMWSTPRRYPRRGWHARPPPRVTTRPTSTLNTSDMWLTPRRYPRRGWHARPPPRVTTGRTSMFSALDQHTLPPWVHRGSRTTATPSPLTHPLPPQTQTHQRNRPLWRARCDSNAAALCPVAFPGCAWRHHQTLRLSMGRRSRVNTLPLLRQQQAHALRGIACRGCRVALQENRAQRAHQRHHRR